MAGQPISISSANDMIAGYIDYMTKLGVDMNNQTQSVSFTGATLTHWLNTVMPFADELRSCMGCYLAGHPNAGRTTVILWPYLNGQPAKDGSGNTINPYNEGTGTP